MPEILLSKKTVGGTRIEVEASVDGSPLPLLWYELSGPTRHRLKPRDASFMLTAFLPYAMATGSDLRISEAVSSETLANLEEWQDAWARLLPDRYKRVSIEAPLARRVRKRRKDDQAVLAFSGGLDAAYTLAAHATRSLGHRSRRIGLAVMVQGFDIPLTEQEAFSVAFESATRITDRFSTPLCVVTTNWRRFSPNWESTFVAGIASVLHLFSGEYDIGIISSGDPYESEVRGWGSSSSTDGLMGNATFPLLTTGFGVGRTEKAAFLSAFPDVIDQIRVCWEDPTSGRNCGKCEKCVRTALNFLAIGVDSTASIGPVSIEQIDSITISNLPQLYNLKEILVADRSLPAEIRSKLSQVIEREARRLDEKLAG